MTAIKSTNSELDYLGLHPGLPLFHLGPFIFLIYDEDNQSTCIIELLFGLRGLILTCSEQCLAGNKCYTCLLYNQNR